MMRRLWRWWDGVPLRPTLPDPAFVPPVPDVPPRSVAALEQWMIAAGANRRGYDIGGHPVDEGFILAARDGGYDWLYTERGTAHLDRRFDNEASAVAHAFDLIRHDPWAFTHMIGFTASARRQRALAAALARRGVAWWGDSIPYGGPDDPRHRVFVFGTDVQKVQDLRRLPGNHASP